MKNYKHILLAIDLYENDEALITEALNLAKTYGSSLSMVHVAPHVTSSVPFAYDFQDAVIKHVKEKFADLKTRFKLNDSQLILAQGSPKHEIIETAKEIGADLIVCGSHGKHGLELMLGSTANGILHLANVDVLTIRINETGKHLVNYPYKNIVLAVDFHESNKKVRERAVELAKTFNAKIHVIHAIADLAALGYYPAIEIDLGTEAKKQVEAILTKEALPVAKDNIHVTIGLPKQEILELSKQVRAELIVVGSHGYNAVTSAVLGSTANAVLHGAKADVMVIRI